MAFRVFHLTYIALISLAFIGFTWLNPWFSWATSASQNLNQTTGGNIPKIPPENYLIDATIETSHPGPKYIHGFTILDQLYMWNGTFYIVTSNASSFPTRRMMISRPLDMRAGVNTEPSDTHLQFLHPNASQAILGINKVHLQGFTIILYDPTQFMTHYYHWWGELILGAWRIYSSLGLHNLDSPPLLPFPSRIFAPHASGNNWRDKHGLNAPLMRAAFPDAPIQNAEQWDDLVRLNKTVVFDRVVIVDRSAAHRNPLTPKLGKMIAGTTEAEVNPQFWAPIRNSVVSNLVGKSQSSLPLVTYVSRQGTKRRLTEESDISLVNALRELEVEGICEVYVARMEKMTLHAQIELAARSTILIGVHGNGLTHQLWMPSSLKSAIYEIMYPQSYVFDYEFLARNVGHKHFAVWNDTMVTFPKGENFLKVNYGDSRNFHGSSIPVNGPAVAQSIRDRLLAN